MKGRSRFGALEIVFIVLALLVIVYVGGPLITGFVTKEASYSEQPSLIVASSGEYEWGPLQQGELLSLKIDGSLSNNGSARVYLESNGIRKLVLDSAQIQANEGNEPTEGVFNTTLSAITGFVQLNNAPVYVGETRFEVEGKTKINLDKQFSDDENDKLSYSAASPLNLEIDIKNGQMTITPDEGFSGERTAFISASDGTTATEQAITLVVAQKEETEERDEEENEGKNEMQEDDDSSPEPTEQTTDETTNEAEEEADVTFPIDELLNSTLSINETAINETTLNETLTNETRINETTSKTISNGLSYGDNPLYDPNNDGVETQNGVVDFLVGESLFDWDVDTSKLCTRWEVYSEDSGEATGFCNGNSDCCAFVDLAASSDSWDAPYYSTYNKHGATENNVVSSQMVYYDVNLDIDNLTSDIAYSEWSNLTAKYATSYVEFSNQCLETCSLSSFNKTSYRLIFEIEGEVVLKIDSLDYTVRQEVGNTVPVLISNFSNITMMKNREFSLNLSNHFSDLDGDSLLFSYYKPSNVTIMFNGTLATIIPDADYTGTAFTFISANDSDYSVTSNIFRIDVVESAEEASQRVSVGEPVVWTQEIAVSDLVNDTLSLDIPETALNVSVDVISGAVSEKVLQTDIVVEDNGQEKSAKELHDEKKIEQLERKMALLEEGRQKGAELVVLDGQNVTKEEFLSVLPELTQEKEDLEDGVVAAIPTEDIDNITTVVVENITSFSPLADTVVIEYVTEAPVMIQTEKTPTLHEVLITSETHYTDVFVGADIPESEEANIAVYWIINGTRNLFSNVTHLDTNLDGSINRLEWVVPHLSNQTFEIVTDTSTQWDEGTFVNMRTTGTGSAANLTSSGRNVSGSYGSRIFDAGSNAIWRNITWVTPVPYGDEIGRVLGENNSAPIESGLVNTSGLILLMHLNNESELGENDTLFYDFSKNANNERALQPPNNGTCSGATCPVYSRTNKLLGASSITFDGNGDYISLGDGPFDMPTSFTLGGWMNVQTSGASRYAIWKRSSYGIGYGTTGEGGAADQFSFHLLNTVWTGLASGKTVEIGKWHFVVGVFDDSNNLMRIYIDGDLAASQAFASSVDSSNFDFRIGNYDGAGPSETFPGSIDEAFLFNRTLSNQEIKNLYMRGAHRVNMSVRSCDDPACSGESWVNMGSNGTFGRTIPLSLSENRYFQYNLTYSRNDTYYNDTIVNNVTFNYFGPSYGVSNCSLLDRANTTYLLWKNISTPVPSNAPCFNITASGVTLDCAGMFVNGTDDGFGVYAENVQGITIRRCTFTNWGNDSNEAGVYLLNVGNSTISSTNISGGRHGIDLYSSSQNNISNTTANLNQLFGLWSQYSGLNNISSSSFNVNNYADVFFSVNGDRDCTNTFTQVNVTGNYSLNYYNSPINLANLTLSNLLLCNADGSNLSNITVYGNISGLAKNNGLLMFSTDWSNLSNLNLTRSWRGLDLVKGSNNTFSFVTSTHNSEHSIYIEYNSSNNRFTNITSSYNALYGIAIESGSSNNQIINATTNSNYGGILIASPSNSIIELTSRSNSVYGVILYSSSSNVLSQVTSTSNAYGVYFLSATLTNLTAVNASLNSVYGIAIDANSNFNRLNRTTTNSNSATGFLLIGADSNSISQATSNSNTDAGFAVAYDASSNAIDQLTSNFNGWVGLWVYQSSNNSISRSTIKSNVNVGVLLQDNANSNNLSDIVSNSNSWGGYLLDSSSNRFFNLSSNSNAGHGMVVSGGTSNTFSQTKFSNNPSHSLYIITSNNSFISNLTINGTFVGIAIDQSKNLTFINSYIYSPEWGIYYSANPSNITFFNTLISNVSRGINIDGSENSFNFLTINGTSTDSIVTQDASVNATIRNAILSGCALYGINPFITPTYLDFNYIANYSCNLGTVSKIYNNYSLSSYPFAPATNGGFYLPFGSLLVDGADRNASNATSPDGSVSLSNYYTQDVADFGTADLGYHYSVPGEGILTTGCRKITTPGIYNLTASISQPTLSSNAPCFNISSSNVTLDCRGNFVNGSDDGYGVYAENVQGVTIRNCTFTHWGNGGSEGGIYLSNAGNSSISYVNASSGYKGIYLTSSPYSNVSNSIALGNNGGVKLAGGDHYLLSNISISGSSFGFDITYVSDSNITKSVSNNNQYGAYVDSSSYVTFINVTTNSNNIAGVWYSSSLGYFSNFTSKSNLGEGLYLTQSGNIVEDSDISSNGGNGIYILAGTDTFRRIRVDSNANGINFGVGIASSSILTNITANSNSQHGVILVGGGHILQNITANSNGNAGVVVSSDSNNLSKIVTNSNYYGLLVSSGSYNKFSDVLSSGGQYGVYVESSKHDNFTSISLNNASISGLHLSSSASNLTFFNTLVSNSSIGITLGGKQNTFSFITINGTSQSAINVSSDVNATVRNAIISGCVNIAIGGINNSAASTQLDFNYIANYSCRLGNVSGILNNYSLSSYPFAPATNGGFYLSVGSSAIDAGDRAASDSIAPDRSFNLSTYYTHDVIDSDTADLGYHYSIAGQGIPFNSCRKLGIAGTYTLTANISQPSLAANAPCFNITASGVTLDCAGMFVNGSDDGYGVYAKNVQGITIKNCSFWNWGNAGSEAGISFNYVGNSTITNINVSSNNPYGIHLYISSSNNVSFVSSLSDTSYGLRLESGTGNRAWNITSASSNANIGLISETSGFLLNSRTIGGSYGIQHTGSSMAIENFTSTGASFAGVYVLGASNNLTNIEVRGATTYGVSINSNNNLLTNITTNSNSGTGLHINSAGGSIIRNSTSQNNSQYDVQLGASTNSDCAITFDGMNISRNDSLAYYNYSVKIENRTFSELILCNADGSNFTNVTISGSNELDNNGLFLYLTSSTRFTNINSSDNYYGVYESTSASNSYTNITANSNSQLGMYIGASNVSNAVANSNSGGIELAGGSSRLSNSVVNSNTGFGVHMSGSDNNIITNVTMNSNADGLNTFASNYNNFTNITTNSNGNRGIVSFGSAYNTYSNIVSNSNAYGLYFYADVSNTVTNMDASSNSIAGVYLFLSTNSNKFTNVSANKGQYGAYLYSANKNNFTNFAASNLSVAGIYFTINASNTTFFNTLINNATTGISLSGYNNSFNFLTVNGTSISAIQATDRYVNASFTNTIISSCGPTRGGVNLSSGGTITLNYIANYSCLLNNATVGLNNYSLPTYPFDQRSTNGGFYLNQSHSTKDGGDREAIAAVSPDGSVNLSRYYTGGSSDSGTVDLGYHYAVSGSIPATYTNFNGRTTNFNAQTDMSNVCNAVIENQNKSMIEFRQCISSTGMDFNSAVRLLNNSVFMNVSALNPTINVSANITLYNLSFGNPLILADYNDDGIFESCTDCAILSYASSGSIKNLTFNVSHFTSYKATDSTNLSIYSQADTEAGSKPFSFNFSGVFFANYSLADGTPLGIASSNCTFSHNATGSFSTPEIMRFNISYNNLYHYNYTPNVTGFLSYNITCYSYIPGIDNLSLRDNFTVQQLIVSASFNSSRFFYSAPYLIFGKINLSNGTNVSYGLVDVYVNGTLITNGSFIDASDSDFGQGTRINLTIYGSGAEANITLGRNESNQYPNATGNFTSRVFDARTLSNWTFISWGQELPYQQEIGRALNDGTSAATSYANTSGLVMLIHFNNETFFGENDSLVSDFSIEANQERSGTRLNGTCFGSFCPTYNFSDRKLGKGSMRFDGSNDYLNFTETDILDVGTHNFTISAWIRPPNSNQASAFISKRNPASPYHQWSMGVSDGTVGYGVGKKIYLAFVGDGNGINDVATTGDIVDGNWHHIVGIINYGVSFQIYVDGSETPINILRNGGWSSSNTDRSILIGSGNGDFYYNGLIDEVAVFNRSLSSSEILNIYKRGTLYLNISTRTSNDSSTWSEWSAPYQNGSSSVINTSFARYLQYKASLSSDNSNYTPNLNEVTINHSGLFADAYGNYNYTLSIAQDGNYQVKVNSTYLGYTGQNLKDILVYSPTLRVQLMTMNDTYGVDEIVNLTDPPGNFIWNHDQSPRVQNEQNKERGPLKSEASTDITGMAALATMAKKASGLLPLHLLALSILLSILVATSVHWTGSSAGKAAPIASFLVMLLLSVSVILAFSGSTSDYKIFVGNVPLASTHGANASGYNLSFQLTDDPVGMGNASDLNGTLGFPYITLGGVYAPASVSFDAEQSTNFSNEADIRNVCNARIVRTNYGKVEWKNCINAEGMDFDSNVRFDEKKAVKVISENLHGSINTAANITFYDVHGIRYPLILRNGEVCTNCTVLSWNVTTGVVVFNVTGFSNYTAAEANQSKVVNYGANNQTFYLLLKVQFFNNVTGAWVDSNVLENDTTPRNISNMSLIKLDSLFNGRWNTSTNATFGEGRYRVYASARDGSGQTINNTLGELAEASYNFTVNVDLPVLAGECMVFDRQGETYKVTQNIKQPTITSNGVCFNVTANYTTLDCQGLFVNGTDDGYGVWAENVQGITIKNCSFWNWGNGGIESGVYFTNVGNSTVRDVNASINYYGMYLSSSSQNTIANSIVSSNSQNGMYLTSSSHSNISQITANSNGAEGVYAVSGSIYNNLSFVTALSNGNAGITLYGGDYSTLRNITINGSTYGLYFIYSSYVSTSNATLTNNVRYDFDLQASSRDDCSNTFTNVTVTNGAFGFYNSTAKVENQTFGELMLCNADRSNVTNVNVTSGRGSNGILLYWVSNSTFRNINSSGNYAGIYQYWGGGAYNNFSQITVNNNQFGIETSFFAPTYSTYSNITANGNNRGIEINGNHNVLTWLSVSYNSDGVYAGGGFNNTYSNINGMGNSNVGIWVITASSTSSNMRLTNATLSGGSYGILISNSNNNTFSNIYLSNHSTAAVSLSSNPNNNTFFNTLISNATTGILLDGAENTFNFLTINATYTSAIRTTDSAVNATIRNTIISGCVNPQIGGLNNSAAATQLDFNYIANYSCLLGNVSGILNNYSLSSYPFSPATNGGFYLGPGSAATDAGDRAASDAVAPDGSFNLSTYFTQDVADYDTADLGYHYSTAGTGIPFNSCRKLGVAGTYTLTANISQPSLAANAPCFNITASGVTLDCAGMFVNGSDDGYGVYASNVQGITIKNCSFWNWGDSSQEAGVYWRNVDNSVIKEVNASINRYGISMEGSTSNDNNLTRIMLSYNTAGGSYLTLMANNSISNITALNNSGYGLFLGSGAQYNSLTNITIRGSSTGIFLQDYNNLSFSTVSENTAYGAYFSNSNGNSLWNVTLQENKQADVMIGGTIGLCSQSFSNLTISGGGPFGYYNYSVDIGNQTFSELILCNADGSNLTNITIDGSSSRDNNGLFMFNVDNATLRNINSSDNYYGVAVSSGSYNTLLNITANGNIQGIVLTTVTSTLVANSTTNNNQYGIYIQSSSSSNTLSDVTSSYNTNDGIAANSATSNSFLRITANGNTNYGIDFALTSLNNFTDVTTNENGYGFYLFSTSSSRVRNLTTSNNGVDGVFLFASDTSNDFANVVANSNSNGMRLINTVNSNNFANISLGGNNYGLYFATNQKNNFTNTHIYNSTTAGVYLSSDSSNHTFFNTLINNATTGIVFGGVNNTFDFLTINGTSTSAIRTTDTATNATLRNVILSGCKNSAGINLTGGGDVVLNYVANYSCLLNNATVGLNNYSLSTYPFDEWLPTNGFGGFYLNQNSLAVDAGNVNSSDALSPDRSFNLSMYSTGRYGDFGIVDLGYHYPTGPLFTLRVQLRTLNDTYISNQLVNLTDPPNLGIGPWDQGRAGLNSEGNDEGHRSYWNDKAEGTNSEKENLAAITGMAAAQKAASGLLPLHLIALSAILSVLLALSVYWTSSGAGKSAPIASFILMLLLSVSVIFAFSGVSGDYKLVIGNVPLVSVHGANASGYNLTFQLTDDPIGRGNGTGRNITLEFPLLSSNSFGAGFAGFDGSTTDFNSQADITNVCRPVLEQSAYAKIEWKNCVNAENQNFEANVVMRNGVVDVRSSSLHTTFNTSANITLYSLSGIRYPLILRNGEVCSDCTVLSWDDVTRTAVFNVTGFSNYTVSEANQSKITNYGLLNQSAYLLMKVQFYDSDSSSWIDSGLLENLTPQTVENLSLLKLDSLFNGRWNTSANATYGSGTYRVYAAVTNYMGDVLQSTEGSAVEASYNFSVDLSQEPATVNVNVGGGFIIQNATGSPLMAIDSSGNVNIKGSLFQNTQPVADSNDFTILNSSGGVTASLRNPQGNLYLKGSITQGQSSLSPTLSSFIIQNSTGATVAYFNSTGHLLTIGTVSQNVNFG